MHPGHARSARCAIGETLAVALAWATPGCDAPRTAPASQPVLSAPATRGAAGGPTVGHWAQDPRLRTLMAELNQQNPTWPDGRPRESESPAAATRAYQFDEMAVLAGALAKAADDIPAATSHVPMNEADRAGFLAEARTLRVQAVELRAAAGRRNVVQMQQQMDGINATCISCHSRYRDFAGLLNRVQASNLRVDRDAGSTLAD